MKVQSMRQIITAAEITGAALVFASSALLAGLAVGTASTAWADTTMSGHYIRTQTGRDGAPHTADWYFTPCGDGCASVVSGSTPLGQAQFVNGQWTVDGTANAICPDGTFVPNASSVHYTWDPNTLAGTVQETANLPACGAAPGYQETDNVQLRQAP
jgi:hypothetical protein